MIRRVVQRGVSPERLAKALAMDVSHILKKLSLLDGICLEAPNSWEIASSRWRSLAHSGK
ncbi:hypothetical protein LMG27174_04263 [Paraburkholderia rhynchosiae]|uniref:Uncharacterized protein n=1 Tax=Paraburkholderia rhynchosiae TaxID=487049 RepID=A0A6J5BPU0_9BURK|nr:hypothetical protein LMG27174_04263 [Paraburkholderia rhynchosiae]